MRVLTVSGKIGLVLVCVLACATTLAWAQPTTATLNGTVVDETGAVVPDVEVTVENIATGLRRQMRTSSKGGFTVPLLPPGRYLVTAQQKGFTPVEVPDVVLNVGDQVGVRLQLKVAALGEGVTVVADPQRISTAPSVSTVIDRQFVGNLPLNGRSLQALFTLTPGVVLSKTVAGGLEQGQFSVNGQRPNSNYFMIDGVSANVGASTGAALGQAEGGSLPGLAVTGGTNNLVSIDALEEFSIQTSSFAPEFGRTPGGQIAIVTRSGTNAFHGSVFEYFRDATLDANDWFANSRNLPKPDFRQHDFGAVTGGPLQHNRAFFFVSYEGLRVEQPQASLSSVPTPDARLLAPPAIRTFLDAYPLPNGRSLGDGNAEFSAAYSNPITMNATSVRIDGRLSGRLNVFGRYNHAPSTLEERTSNLLSRVDVRSRNTDTLTTGATFIWSPRLLSDVRVNWSRGTGTLRMTLDDFGGATPPPDATFFPYFGDRERGFGYFSVGSNGQLTVGSNNDNIQRQVNVVSSVSLVTARHQVKLGVDYRRMMPIINPNPYILGAQFDAVMGPDGTAPPGTALSGIATRVSVGANQGPRFPIFTNLSLFIQDAWRPVERLTLTYGLRWEYEPPPVDANGLHALAVTTMDDLGAMRPAPYGTKLHKTAFDHLAPRVGAAYRLTDAGAYQATLRGGFGVFYDLLGTRDADGFGGFPYNSSTTLLNTPYPLDRTTATPPPFLDPRNLTYPITGTVRTVDPNLAAPYTYQWNVSVDQHFGALQELSLAYVGATARRLLHGEAFTQAGGLDPSIFAGSFRATRSLGRSRYQGVQAQYQRRLSDGLQLLVSYTLSKATDTTSTSSYVNHPLDPANPNRELGPSDSDQRHGVSGAFTWNVPAWRTGVLRTLTGDWWLDGVVRAYSGRPINVVTGTDQLNVGLTGPASASRPDVVPGVPFYLDDPSAPGGRRLNREAFDVLTPTTEHRQGTLGRNALRGLASWQVDLALRRRIPLSHHLDAHLRMEAFNLFNHPNFGDPVAYLNVGDQPNPLFGLPSQMLGRSLVGLNPLYQIGGPRSIQLGVKLAF